MTAEINLEYFMGLPYTIEVTRDAGEEYSGWFARVVELPGCMTQGDTFEELGEMIEDAMRLWIETAAEDGQEIPEPRPAESYSGKFIVRVPRALHRELVEAADRENVSLNLFVSTALGKAVGGAALRLRHAGAYADRDPDAHPHTHEHAVALADRDRHPNPHA
jgi:antitoxin HicB